MPGNSKLVHSSSPRPSFPAHLTTSSTIRARSRDQLAFALAFPFVLAFAFDFASPLGLGSAWGGVQGSGVQGLGLYIYIYYVCYIKDRQLQNITSKVDQGTTFFLIMDAASWYAFIFSVRASKQVCCFSGDSSRSSAWD